MALNGLQFPKVNLLRHNVTTLLISWDSEWNSRAESAFADLDGPDVRLFNVVKYRRQYSGKRSEYLLVEEAHKEDEPSPQLRCSLLYEHRDDLPKGRVPIELTDKRGLLSRVAGLTDQVRFRCHLHFEFQDETPEGINILFPLPYQLVQEDQDDNRKFEIEGIRGRRLPTDDDADTLYHFTIDRLGLKTTRIILEFDMMVNVSDSAIESVLTAATIRAHELII